MRFAGSAFGKQTMTSSETTEPAEPLRAGNRVLTAVILALPLVLLLAVLISRSGALQVSWLRNITGLPILKDTMGAVDGEQVPMPATLARLRTTKGPDGTQARALARIALEQGRPSEAERWLVAGMADADTADLTRFELCRLYQEQGRLDAAKVTCADTIVSAPFWLGQGLRAAESGLSSLAIDYFDLARTTDPNLLTAWVQLGHALYAEKRYAEAVPVFEHVVDVEASPEAAVFDQLSQSLLNSADIERAQEIMKRGIELHPTARSLFRAMAESYRRQGDATQADEWYLNLLKRWPEDAFAWAGRGELALQRGSADVAIDYYQEAVRLNADDAGYWLGLAEAAETAGETDIAANAYDQALALHPDDVSTLLRAGRFLSATDKVEEARAAFERVLTLQPGNVDARQWLDDLVARQVTP